MIRRLDDNIVRRGRYNRLRGLEHEIIATMEAGSTAVLVVIAGAEALGKCLRHAPRSESAVPSPPSRPSTLTAARDGLGAITGLAEVPGRTRSPPECLGKCGRQDWNIGRDDADNGLAHAPTVDIHGAGVCSDGQNDPNDCCCYDEDSSADEHADQYLPAINLVCMSLSLDQSGTRLTF